MSFSHRNNMTNPVDRAGRQPLLAGLVANECNRTRALNILSRPIELDVLLPAGSSIGMAAQVLALADSKARQTGQRRIETTNSPDADEAVDYRPVQQQKPDGHSPVFNSFSTIYHSSVAPFGHQPVDPIVGPMVEKLAVIAQADASLGDMKGGFASTRPITKEDVVSTESMACAGLKLQ